MPEDNHVSFNPAGSQQLQSFHDVTICRNGKLIYNQQLSFSAESGLIHQISDVSDNPDQSSSVPSLFSAQSFTLPDPSWIVAPGLLELQTNGLIGVHFTTLGQEGVSDRDDEERLAKVARVMATNGVTGWWATVPTVHEKRWPEILRLLAPRSFPNDGSPLLGAHVEGPYLHPSKKGAHNDAYFKSPSIGEIHQLYGEDMIPNTIKLITLAPELPGAVDLIRELKMQYPTLAISLGHSSSTYETGVEAVQAGATCLTHVFNAMNPLHHRDPGLAGLISLPQRPPSFSSPSTSSSSPNKPRNTDTASPYYSIIPDLIHIHPALLRLAYHSNPSKCILITDSIELAGLPDGTYPPNGQITYPQRKVGNRATNIPDFTKGQKETLIGSCITLPECVRNMVSHAGIGIAEAVRCATENVAELMGETGRGKLEVGRRADFVVLDWEGKVRQTWIAGRKVFDADQG